MSQEQIIALAERNPWLLALVVLAMFVFTAAKTMPALSRYIESRRPREEREFVPTMAWADKQETRAKELHALGQKVQVLEMRTSRLERMARTLADMREDFTELRVAAEGTRTQMISTQERMSDFCDRLARIEDRLINSGPKTP